MNHDHRRIKMTVWTAKEIDGLKGVPYLDDLSFKDYQLFLKLNFIDLGKRLVHFESCWSFRFIQEGRAFQTLDKQKWGNCFYTTDKSNFIDWFNYESENVYQADLKQFNVITCNDIIEVITDTEPKIILLD